MQNVFRGKNENCKASWSKVSEKKKAEIKKIHKDLNDTYLSQLKIYLESLSQSVSIFRFRFF